MALNIPPSPRLNDPPKEYAPNDFMVLVNLLRLYFNRLSAALAALCGLRGGQYLTMPYGSFSSQSNLTTSGTYVPTRVVFTVEDFASGMHAETSDGAHVEQSGLYNIQFSIQFTNTDTQIRDAYVWLKKNGADVPYTGSRFAIPNSHGGVNGHTIAVANFFVSMVKDDHVELWWSAESTTVSMLAAAATSSPYVLPSIPSAVITLCYVSALE